MDPDFNLVYLNLRNAGALGFIKGSCNLATYSKKLTKPKGFSWRFGTLKLQMIHFNAMSRDFLVTGLAMECLGFDPFFKQASRFNSEKV